jgi:CspA family cold shock protein
MAKTITANLKFFNQEKGYGFFKRPDGDDIFVHASVVTKSGFSPKSMMANVEATFVYEANGDRKQVTVISRLGGLTPRPQKEAKKSRRQSKKPVEQDDAKIGAYHVGRVKFFDEDKGFGFLVILDESGLKDVFMHISAVPAALQPPMEGDVFDITIEKGRDGRPVALVLQEHDGEYADQRQAA